MAHSARPDPLVDVLAGLVRDGTLSEAQARQVADALRSAGVLPAQRRGTATAAEVLTYLGAALAIGALTLVVGLSWDELGSLGQVLVCSAVTVVFLGLAVGVGVWRSSVFAHRRHTVASVLAALATVGAAVTTDVLTGDVLGLNGPWPLLVVGAVAVVFGAGSYLGWRAAPSVVVTFAGGLAVLAGLLDLADTWPREETVYALVYYAYGALCASVGWLLRHRHTAGVLGGATMVVGAEALAFESPWLGLVLGLVAVGGMLTLFWLGRGWWYAALGVLGALAVPATAVGNIWSGAVAAAVLLAVGVLLVAAALVLAGRGRRSA